MIKRLASDGDVQANSGPIRNAEKIDKLQNAVESLIAASNQNQRENANKIGPNK